MGKLKGETIQLLVKKESTKDEFNHTKYICEWIYVENVLIAPATSNDIKNSVNITGKEISYLLAIPKRDTNDWKNTRVKLWGKEFETVGDAIGGIESNIPLEWNKKIGIKIYE